MITLADLAALQDAHGDAWDSPVTPVVLDGPRGPVVIGDGPVTLMGCVNLSRDSTYRESVATSPADAVRMGRIQAAQGAAIIDLGAESSNARAARVSADDQIATLVPAVKGLAAEAVVSVETYEPAVVRACLEAGARILNMTGREHEDEMLALAAEYDAAVVMCFGETANVREIADVPPDADPIPVLLDHFAPADRARPRASGSTRSSIDPGMGFYYGNLVDPPTRARHQARVLAQGFRLRPLGVPVCNAVPHSYDIFGDEFRKAEGFYAVFAALGGTHLVRTHEVAHLRRCSGARRARGPLTTIAGAQPGSPRPGDQPAGIARLALQRRHHPRVGRVAHVAELDHHDRPVVQLRVPRSPRTSSPSPPAELAARSPARSSPRLTSLRQPPGRPNDVVGPPLAVGRLDHEEPAHRRVRAVAVQRHHGVGVHLVAEPAAHVDARPPVVVGVGVPRHPHRRAACAQLARQ